MTEKSVPTSATRVNVESSLEFDRGWLSGFFDAEGNVYVTGHRGPVAELTAANTDKDLVDACIVKLRRFGIDPRVRVLQPPGRRQIIWHIKIRRKDSIETFYLEIGFVTARKQDMLRKAVEVALGVAPINVTRPSDRTFRIGWLTGFFEGDGSCSTSHLSATPARRISIVCTDSEVTDTYSAWLAKEGIRASARSDIRRGTTWKRQYILRINTAHDQEMLASLLRPQSRRRRLQISTMCELIKAQRLIPGRITAQSVLPLHALDVLKMRATGSSIRAIGLRYGVTHQAVHLFLANRIKNTTILH